MSALEVAVRFEVLGPVRAVDDAGEHPPVSPLRRRLLAVLLARANHPVSADVLADVLWGEDQPEHPGKSLQVHVHRLRPVLDRPDRLAAVAGGYLLQVGPGELDAADFAAAQADARRFRESGDLGTTVDTLRAALTLWRGAPYADVDDAQIVGPQARRLAEARLLAYEELGEAELARGRAREVVPELTDLVARFPLRERFVAQLMLALYRSGRRTRALTAFRAAGRRLAQELAAGPGRELRDLHDAILADDPVLLVDDAAGRTPTTGRAPAGAPPGPGSAPIVPGQLPPAPGAFAGRATELAELKRVTSGDDTTVVVATGMAGVGKTGLVLRHAHHIAPRFGDGQLYLDLRGHAPEPALEPLEALGHLLRGLGADPRQVGTSVDAASAEYRSRIAGRTMLVVLDNAATAEQVRPLLPAAPGCVTLVTSRNRLPGLVAHEGVHVIGLGVLPRDDALALLTGLIGTRRVAAEPDHTTALIDACARLPLALRIAAAQLAGEPHRSIADYVAELRDGGLSTLALDDDPHASVAAAFDLSYHRLDPDARRAFRLLGLLPGLDFTTDAAAALTGVSPESARRLVRRLTRAHLLEEHASGRYRLHDLLRDYARLRALAEDTDEQRRAALEGVYTWYYQGKEAAEALLRTHRREPPRPELSPGVPQPPMPDERTAAAWLQQECHNIVAAARQAAQRADTTGWSWHLVLGLGVPIARRGFLGEALTLLGSTVDATRAAGDRHALAHALTEFGAVQTLAGTPVSDDLVAEALAHAESAGDRAVQGYCLYMAGVVAARGNEHAKADDLLERSAAICRRIGDDGGLALALNQLGGLAQSRGELRRAVRLWETMLDLAESPATRSALINLSSTRIMLGEFDGVESMLDRAERLVVQHDESAAACVLMETRAGLYRITGRAAEALDLLVVAGRRADELGIPRLRASIGAETGFVYLALGDADAARGVFDQAIGVARASGLREQESAAVRGLAEAHLATGDPAAAQVVAGEAIDLAGGDHHVHRADALITLAEAELAAGRPDDALAHAAQAMSIHRRTEHHLGTAQALRVLGDAKRRSAAAGSPPLSGRR